MIDVRPSPIAGRWYEGDPDTLARTVDQYLEDVQLPDLEGDVMGVIAPHAGHIYSGEVAGYAFAALRGLRPDLVIVAGPMHHPYSQPLITTTHDAYFTPLGTIPVEDFFFGFSMMALTVILWEVFTRRGKGKEQR